MQTLGHYRIDAQIGQGAMGIVYRAVDDRLERTVALKVLRLSLSDTERAEYSGRLQQEAKSAARLNHPGIITVYDCGDVDGYAFLAMEFVEGKSLQALYDSGVKLSASRIQKLADQLFGALAYAHEHDVVHRDIKPANLMLTPDARLKITDFGIALVPTSDLTRTGTLVGSPRHMAPEQIEGKKVDGRADLFAAGIVLYELLTGIKPFDGEHLASIAYKILHENVADPRNFNPDVSDALASVVMRCLEKDPQKRFQTAREARAVLRAQKLEAKKNGDQPLLPPIEKPYVAKLRRYGPWAAGGALVLAVAIGGINAMRPGSAVPQTADNGVISPAPSAKGTMPALANSVSNATQAPASDQIAPSPPDIPADASKPDAAKNDGAKPGASEKEVDRFVFSDAKQGKTAAVAAKGKGKHAADRMPASVPTASKPTTEPAVQRQAASAPEQAKPAADQGEKQDSRTFWQRLRGCDESGNCPNAQPHTAREK